MENAKCLYTIDYTQFRYYTKFREVSMLFISGLVLINRYNEGIEFHIVSSLALSFGSEWPISRRMKFHETTVAGSFDINENGRIVVWTRKLGIIENQRSYTKFRSLYIFYEEGLSMSNEYKRFRRIANEIMCSSIGLALVPVSQAEDLQTDTLFHAVYCNEPLCKPCIKRRSSENRFRLLTALLEWMEEDTSVDGESDGRFVYCSVLLKGTKEKVETHFKRSLKLRTDNREKYSTFHGLTGYRVGVWVVEECGVGESELRFLGWHPVPEAASPCLTEHIEHTMLEVFLSQFDVEDVKAEWVVTGDGADGEQQGMQFRELIQEFTKPFGPLADWIVFNGEEDTEEYESRYHELADAISRLKGQELLHTFGLDFEESKPGKPVLFIDQRVDIYVDEALDEVIYHYNPFEGDEKQQVSRRAFEPRRFEAYYNASEPVVDFDEKQFLLGEYAGLLYDNPVYEGVDNLIEFQEHIREHTRMKPSTQSKVTRNTINPLMLATVSTMLKGERK